MKTRIAIADDHLIFREGFKLVLKHIENVQLVGEAENGQELVELIKKEDIDIIFMDINMPLLNGFDATKEILEFNNTTKIIALTAYKNINSVNKMVSLGVKGYMLKDAEFTEISNAIEIVMSNKHYFSNDVLIMLSKQTAFNQSNKKTQEQVAITEREKTLLKLLCKGLSKKEISQKMYISERTVEKYKERIMTKTNTNSTVNLVLYAIKNRLVKI